MRAVLVGVDFGHSDFDASMEELMLLSRSAGADPISTITAKRSSPDSAYFVGSGKADEIGDVVVNDGLEIVIFNHALSPAQQRNLEKRLNVRVLDRTSLILDIFAQRAKSHEGKLQVELAQLQHLATRLIRGWTHLERQKGGIGLRGPGETQLETDRRLIGDRVKALRARLEKLHKQRETQRRARGRNHTFSVSLVGYTNAGKSTLFNALTGAEAYAADKLFATLDPTVRRIELPGGGVVLADTVGFVRDLPHELVAAFRSTLSEAREADLLLHVIDADDPLRDERISQVDEVLTEIGAGEIPQLMVFNKIDRIEGAHARIDQRGDERSAVWLSARDGIGLDLLRQALGDRLGLQRLLGEVVLPTDAGRLRARLHALDAVRGEDHDADGWRMQLDLPIADALRLAAQDDGAPLRGLLPVPEPAD